MTKPAWARALFYGGLLVAYLPPLLVPHAELLTTLAQLALGGLAVLVALVAGIALAVGFARRRAMGQALGYGVVGLLAPVLYLFAVPLLNQAGDRVAFVLQRPQLEPLIRPHGFAPGQQPLGGFCTWLDSTTFLCMSGGQEGMLCWGYAYSLTGRKPPRWAGNYTYWHHTDGRWYRWVRSDW